MNPKPIQICVSGESETRKIYALCEDGSIWFMRYPWHMSSDWEKLAPIEDFSHEAVSVKSSKMVPCGLCGMAGDELAVERVLDPHLCLTFSYRGTCSSGHYGPHADTTIKAVELWNERQGILNRRTYA